MAFFYLSANFLALVVSASCMKTSKGIIFRCSDTHVPFYFISSDVYIMFLRKYGPKPFSLVIFISLSNTGHAPNIGFVFTNFLSHKGYYLNITTVGIELVQDSSECAFKCLEKDPCLSFNLADLDDNMDNLLCELLASDYYTHSDKFITNHLWYHHSIAVKLVILSSRSFFFFFITSW